MNFDVSCINGVTSDSRKVKAGYLFVAVRGTVQNGEDFIPQAIQNGAKFIAVKSTSGVERVPSVEWIEVDNPAQFLAQMAADFYAHQPKNIYAVTGTNGKTSTVNFVRMILELLDKKAASIGTLGVIGKGLTTSAGMTTPDAVTLFSTLASLKENGFETVALEASSHGLHQYRLDGVKLRAAGFTNLTRDHLDYHGTFDEYFVAKIRLFAEILPIGGVAVLNMDVPESHKLIEICRARHQKIIGYGAHKDSQLRFVSRKAVADGQEVTLEAFGKTYSFHLNLVGEFQLMNVLCAVGLLLADEFISLDDIITVLPKLSGVVGRLQPVQHNLKNIGVYIDYAHTPDGLETILKALRPHVQNRLICVFGCGGDRDTGKRPQMGEIAGRLADISIVTDDNPRSELPADIRADILKGYADATEIAGRENAIRMAVEKLTEGDVLVVAGKGHEQGQIFADHIEPFDDYSITQHYLSLLPQTS